MPANQDCMCKLTVRSIRDIIHLRFCQRTHYLRVVYNKCRTNAFTYNEVFYQLLRMIIIMLLLCMTRKITYNLLYYYTTSILYIPFVTFQLMFVVQDI